MLAVKWLLQFVAPFLSYFFSPFAGLFSKFHYFRSFSFSNFRREMTSVRGLVRVCHSKSLGSTPYCPTLVLALASFKMAAEFCLKAVLIVLVELTNY